MKLQIKHPVFMLIISVAMISATACKKESLKKKPETKEYNYALTAKIDSTGLKTSSKAQADLSGLYSPKSKKLIYSLNYKNIVPTAIQFRNEKDQMITTASMTSEKYTNPVKGELILTSDHANGLLSQKLYIILLSAKFPKGEIKGTIHSKKQ